jgi:hypothetical protein
MPAPPPPRPVAVQGLPGLRPQEANLAPANPHTLHPAAQKAAADYSDMAHRCDFFERENTELHADLKVARLHVQELQYQLDRAIDKADKHHGVVNTLLAHFSMIEGSFAAARLAVTEELEARAKAAIDTNNLNKQSAEVEEGLKDLAGSVAVERDHRAEDTSPKQ